MKEALRNVLAAYEPQMVTEDGLRQAAVMLLLYEHDGEPHIVFQKRTQTVQDHKGQISLPGGAADPTDTGPDDTALRETHEEIGVAPEHIDVLGRIDDVRTRSNYRMQTFVGWWDDPYPFEFSKHEVAYLIEAPLHHLRQPETLVDDRRMVNGREVVMASYQFGDELIWGATAMVLRNFLDICSLTDA